MTAASARAHLARTARSVAATRGGWRAAALARFAEDRRAPGFADLADAPEWLGWSAPDRTRLGRLAALAHLAPRIARTLDGAVLGTLARTVGADEVEWALEVGDGIDFAPALSVADAASLDALGIALLRASLPSTLAAEIFPSLSALRNGDDAAGAGWATSTPAPLDVAPEAAARSVALALEAWHTLAEVNGSA